MRLADLIGRRVAIWGFGREGHAVISALRASLPQQALTVLCSAVEAEAVQALDASLEVVTGEPDAARLRQFDIVVKSPGISAYKPALLTAQAQGTRCTSGTALWFGENPRARVIGVTGTKGKSTTSALLAHLARALGVHTALAGNIGLPLLNLLGQQAALWVIELSSFQTGEAGPLELGVVTSLYEEHLDWHGSRERYVADKLKLADVSRQLLVNGGQANLLEKTAQHPDRVTFGEGSDWHLADGFICRRQRQVFAVAQMRAPGLHNALTACAALAALAGSGSTIPSVPPRWRRWPHWKVCMTRRSRCWLAAMIAAWTGRRLSPRWASRQPTPSSAWGRMVAALKRPCTRRKCAVRLSTLRISTTRSRWRNRARRKVA